MGDLKIGYAEAGKGNGKTPLIFLHGVGSDKTVWNEQIDYFSSSRRAVAFDYAGYGESGLATEDLTRREIARIIFGAMDRLEIDAAHLFGHSMGGVIALEMFKQSPERLKSLMLADSFGKHPRADEIVERTFSAIETMSMREFAEKRVEVLLMPNAPDALRKKVVDTFANIPKQSFRWATRAVWTPDYLSLLAHINVPALVLVGEHDGVAPFELSKQLAENIKGARLEIIRGASHLSNLEQPQIFNRLIEKFLEKQI